MKKSTWNTYCVTGYTTNVANDQASAGGVVYAQVRKGPAGWQKRLCRANGAHRAYGAYEAISDAEGEAFFERAKTR